MIKISALFKGMVTIDGNTFGYSNIRNMYKHSNGIILSSGEASNYIVEDLKRVCNSIADCVYLIEDTVDGGLNILSKDKSLTIVSSVFAYSYSARVGSDAGNSVSFLCDLPEETYRNIKSLCDNILSMFLKLEDFDVSGVLL